MSSRFLSRVSINLIAFYHKCCNLIGYPTRYLFRDRQWVAKRWVAGAVLYFKITMQLSKTFHFRGILIEIYTKTIRLFALDRNLELII